MSSYVESLNPPAVSVAGGEPDFAALLAENQRRVFHIALSVLADPADAEEVAQEAFLLAHRRLSSLRDPTRFRAWVSRIAFRLALNRWRARNRRLTRETAWQADQSPTQRADGADSVFLERLRAEINLLPEKLRVVLLLAAVEGMDAREVAGVLRIPVGTVRSRLHAARKRLLEVIKP